MATPSPKLNVVMLSTEDEKLIRSHGTDRAAFIAQRAKELGFAPGSYQVLAADSGDVVLRAIRDLDPALTPEDEALIRAHGTNRDAFIAQRKRELAKARRV